MKTSKFSETMRSFEESPPKLAFLLMIWLVSWLQWLIDILSPAPHRALEKALAVLEGQVIFTCVELGLAEALDDCEMTSDELSLKLGIPHETCLRLVKAASQLGFFQVRIKARKFLVKNSRLSAVLHEHHYAALKPFFVHLDSEVNPSMSKLGYSVRTALQVDSPSAFQESASERSLENSKLADGRQADFWGYLEKNPDKLHNFSMAMKASDSLGTTAVVEDFKWSQFERIVDIGGASGSFLKKLLAVHKNISAGVVCDLPQVIEDVKPKKAAVQSGTGLTDSLLPKLSFVPINMLKEESSIPAAQDGDCYVLRVVLHDWDDHHAKIILRNLRKAFGTAKAKLVVVECIPLGLKQSPLCKAQRVMDMTMMAVVKGKEREKADWQLILPECGFKLENIQRTRSVFSVLTASSILIEQK